MNQISTDFELGVPSHKVKSVRNIISDSTALKLGKLSAEPLVSIVVSNYNYGNYIDDAICSVLAQTYRKFEIIICDDGSTDNSEEIYRQYSTDQRIRIIRQERRGQGNAMTHGFDNSCGEIICFLDADDMFLPTKLEMVVNAFQANQHAGVCTHFLQPVSKVHKELGTRVPPYLVSGWLATKALNSGGFAGFALTTGLSIRRGVGDSVFPIPDIISQSGDAYIVGISTFITSFVAIPMILSHYRWHGMNISGGKIRSYELLTDSKNIRDAIFQKQQTLLRTMFSAEIAERLTLNDHLFYLYAELWLHLFAGNRPGRLNNLRVEEILNRLPKSFKNLIRRILLHLPPQVSKLLFIIWTKRLYYFRWSRSLKVISSS